MSTENKKNNPKMRHVEDEKRIIHENTVNESRLKVEETTETGLALRHESKDSNDDTAKTLPAMRGQGEVSDPIDTPDSNKINGESAGSHTDNQPVTDQLTDNGNSNFDGKLSRILSAADNIMPDESLGAQAIKHDVLETPAALFNALSEVSVMRERGQRLFFENKDNEDTPQPSTNTPVTVETGDKTETEPLLALPSGNEAVDGSHSVTLSQKMPQSEKETSKIEITEERCYYEVLGIGKDADEAEIKQAYRTLGKKYHPDVNNGCTEAADRFIEVNNAYRNLIDPEKRQIYDNKMNAKKAATVSTEDKPGVKLRHTPNGKDGDTPIDSKNKKSGKKQKDRFMRRMLDGSFVLSQASTHLMPNEQRDEDSGTKGVRSMISESAKIIKIFATAEKKPSRLQHEDEEKLSHEDTPEENRVEHEQIEGEAPLLLEDKTPRLEHDEVLAIGDGSNDGSNNSLMLLSEDTGDMSDIDLFAVSTKKAHIDNNIENKIDKKIDKLTAEGKKLEKKIKKAESKAPRRKVKKSKLVHDEQTGKTKRVISFADEKVSKADAKWNQPQSRTLAANAEGYVTGHASVFVHGKISEVENQTGNTGIKATHTAQKTLVKGYSMGKNIHRYVRNAPYRQLQHLKAVEARNKGKLAYQSLLKEKPELRKNPIAKMIQKRRIKREYAKALRTGGMTKGKALGAVGAGIGMGAAVISGDGKGAAKMGLNMALKIALKKKALLLIKAAAPILLKLGLILLILAAILLLFTMCASLFTSTTGYILESVSYTADMDDITENSVYITELEVDLIEEILEAATDLTGKHEFRLTINSPGGNTDIRFDGTLITAGRGHPFNELPVYAPPNFDPLVLLPFLNDITHNPFELMAYLSTVYGDFTGHDIKAIIREIFDTAFELEVIENFEIRSATVEAWHFDFEGNRIPPFSEVMFYNWYIREVVLTVNKTISEVIADRLSGNEEQEERFALMMETLGLRQFVSSPFEGNWLGSMTSPYGYRIHPITKTREMHTGIDIAKPEGTPIRGGIGGTVVFAGDNGGYGNTVIIEFIDVETGIGYRVLYAHMHEINVAVGDVLTVGHIIGTVGSTGASTGNHLHMEVRINENGGAWRTINPLFFVEPSTS